MPCRHKWTRWTTLRTRQLPNGGRAELQFRECSSCGRRENVEAHYGPPISFLSLAILVALLGVVVGLWIAFL